jgi:23S rRNA (cytidine1920-2'-O)/16S rRNA (cytidine1409-2'-O)-methyltransferase
VLKDDAGAVILIKPQFEAGKNNIGKNGIVKDPKVHLNVLKTVSESARKSGFTVQGLIPSPITGGDGNIEFLLYLKTSGHELPDLDKTIKEAVDIA